MKLGDDYVEGKILAERALLADARNGEYAPAIIRLGTVVGPGAVPWTATLATHMLLGGVVGRGKSNATYVGNIVDYLCHVSSAPRHELFEFGKFHHLAEFSSITWDKIVEPMCETMGITPRYIDYHSAGPGLRYGLMAMAAGYIRYAAGRAPKKLSDWLAVSGSLFRPYLGFLATGASTDTGGLARVMAERYEFSSHVMPGWNPPHSFGQAIGAICRWLRTSGFVVCPAQFARLVRFPSCCSGDSGP